MKVWLKYLLGIAVGIASALILPMDSPQAKVVLDFIIELATRFGRYTLLPMLFFSIATACYRLQEHKLILKTGAWTFVIIIASSFLLTVLGIASALFIKLPRLPITIEKTSELPVLELKSLLTSLFPYSSFEVLLQGSYLLPCFIFAGLFGAASYNERVGAKAAFTWLDAMNRVCYNVTSFFTELLSLGMIAFMCKWTIEFIALRKTGVFIPLLLLLSADLVITAFVLYPLLLRIVFKEKRPLRVLYAAICPFLAAFFSGDTNLALAILIRHGKESLGIRHAVNGVTFPLFSIFARGGAALVQTVCFIVILRSYSPQELKLELILWIGVISLLLSFVQCAMPTGGPFFALAIMCMSYSPSFEASYLLLREASPIICAFATGFDAITAMFGSYVVGLKTNTIEHIELKNFI